MMCQHYWEKKVVKGLIYILHIQKITSSITFILVTWVYVCFQNTFILCCTPQLNAQSCVYKGVIWNRVPHRVYKIRLSSLADKTGEQTNNYDMIF